jgi:ligand-binding sensor domain-containing protein
VSFHADNGNHSLPDETITRLVWLDTIMLAACTDMGLHIINTLNGEINDIIIPTSDPRYLYKFNTVMSVLSDQQGNIYILTRSGFYHYNAQCKLVFRYDHYSKEATETAWFEFGKNAYWLSDNKLLVIAINGLYTYSTATRQWQKITANDPLLQEVAVMRNDQFLIRQTEPGRLMVIKLLTDSIIYIDGNRNRKAFLKTGFTFRAGEFGWRTKLFPVSDTLSYLTGQQNGFFKIHFNNCSGTVTIDPVKYFPEYLCNDFITGTSNRLWIATYGGLLKETSNLTSVRQMAIPPALLKQYPAANIRQMLCYKNKLYVGCAGNGGLLVFDKNTLSFLYRISFKKLHPLADDIFSILQAQQDTLFVGTNGPLCWLKASTGETGIVPLEGWDPMYTWISRQYKDSRSNIWITTNNNSKEYLLAAGAHHFTRLDYHTGVFKKLLVPIDIKEDLNGNIWISGHGICRLNKVTGKPDLYLDSFPRIRFPRREVTAMAFDQNNVLWAGIHNNGLAAYDISKRTFRHFTMREGLPDNLIKAVCPVNSNLWIATATGMASLDLRNNKIARYGSDDGFLPLPVSNTSLLYDSASQYLYSGFTSHIIRFNPDSLLYTEPPPSVFIESIHLFNDTTYYHPGDTITIPYYKNDMTVTVGSIDFNDVNNQRIAYRIVDSKDMSWQVLPGDWINFNNLPPGNYRLQVKLYSVNNRWPAQEKEMHIIITPPFWQTPWFVLLTGGLLLAVIYLLYKSKINGIRRLASINEQLAEAQLSALQTQMNPHFIFNALNSIKRMILDNENRNASRYLTKFAQMIRLTLNHSKETFVTLQETIEYLHAYLDMEQLRFGSSFSYVIEKIDLCHEEDIYIPTLMIQPLAENAIWHGLMHRQGDKKIIIRFEQCNDLFTCIIEDNGIGIRQSEKMKRISKQLPVGLGNLRNRIKIMNEKYNMNCTLQITDLSEQIIPQTGTRAILQFKILTQ